MPLEQCEVNSSHPHSTHMNCTETWVGCGEAGDRAHSYQSLLTQRLWLQLNHLLFCLSLSLSHSLSPSVFYHVHNKPDKSQNTFFTHLAFSPFTFSFTLRNCTLWTCIYVYLVRFSSRTVIWSTSWCSSAGISSYLVNRWLLRPTIQKINMEMATATLWVQLHCNPITVITKRSGLTSWD